VTQQNAAMVEQAAAKSTSFEEEANRLTGIVARFRIEEDASVAPTAPVRPSPGLARRPLLARR